MDEPVYIVKIIEDVINSMKVPIYGTSNPIQYHNIFYNPGSSNQIIREITNLDGSITQKGVKFPLFAMMMPVDENFESPFYAEVTIPRIVLATRTVTGKGSERVLSKYDDGCTFKSILYPIMYEFFRCLSIHKNINAADPSSFAYSKKDIPGQQEITQGTNDFVDSIEITNLKFSIIQTKTC